MFDTHIHTKNSHDSTQTIDEVCLSAIGKGLKGVYITNHIPSSRYRCLEEDLEVMQKDYEDVLYARKKYGDKLKIYLGAELADYSISDDVFKNIPKKYELDIILGSLHGFYINDVEIHFSRDIMDESVSDEIIFERLKEYFNVVLATAKECDIDTLCHLTYPLRYIVGKYKRNVDINDYIDQITEIFKTIIERNIALEINTSGIGTIMNETMPMYALIKLYYNLGGRLITLGSDAHVKENIAKGFDKVKTDLKEIGFTEYCYFEKRKRKYILL